MRGILRFIFFNGRHFPLLFAVWVCCCLILRFFWLQSSQHGQNNELLLRHFGGEQRICCRHSPCGTPTFFCAMQGFMGKMSFDFYFKTCSDTGVICVYGLMFFRLRFNVLFPDNYLFFREMVIRYIKPRILVVCPRIVL